MGAGAAVLEVGPGQQGGAVARAAVHRQVAREVVDGVEPGLAPSHTPALGGDVELVVAALGQEDAGQGGVQQQPHLHCGMRVPDPRCTALPC